MNTICACRRWPADSHSYNDLRAGDSAINADEKCNEIGMPGVNSDQRGTMVARVPRTYTLRSPAARGRIAMKAAMTYDIVSRASKAEE